MYFTDLQHAEINDEKISPSGTFLTCQTLICFDQTQGVVTITERIEQIRTGSPSAPSAPGSPGSPTGP